MSPTGVLETEPVAWQDTVFLRDPVITSDAQQRRGPGPAAWSRDGRLAYYCVRQADGLAMQVAVTRADGQLEWWTDAPFAATAAQGSLIDRFFAGGPAFSPDGSVLAVAGRFPEDSGTAIYLFTGPGASQRLTRGPGSHRHPAWSPDGKRLAYVENWGGRDTIWVIDVAGGKAVQVAGGAYDATNPAWSPDGRLLAFTARTATQDPLCCQVGVVDVTSGATRLLTPGGRVHSRFPRWHPEGEDLFVLSDAYGVDAIWRIVVATGRMKRVTAARSQDICEFDVSPDGSQVAYVAAVRTDHQLWVGPSDGHAAGRRIGVARGVHRWPAFHPDGRRVQARLETPVAPSRSVIYDLDAPAPADVAGDMPPGVSITQVEFPGYDGQPIDAVLYAPADPPAGRKHPVMLYVHGGPNMQFLNGCWPLFHELVRRGYVVLAPNCRGSTGYGREWMDTNIHDWGEGDRGDWVKAVEFLRQLPYVNGDAIGVWGRSYGGYSTVRALALHPELFKAGIAHFGPVDLAAFYQETVAMCRDLMIRNFGHPFDNPESYRRSSTHQYLDRIQGPLLLLQGEADEGVPPAQMEMVRDTLQARGHPVWYTSYEREGHGFDEPDHVYDAAGRILWFLENHLG